MLVFQHYIFHGQNNTPLLASISGTAIFYFISGFVISMSFERNSLKQWLIKRFFRLYPTILFITFTSLFIVYLKGETTLHEVNIDVKNIITNLTFLFQFLPHNKNTLQDHLYIATTWTICVDFTFYIFLILTYKVCKTPKGRINVIVFFTLFCLVVITILKKKYHIYSTMSQTLRCLLPFYFGMIIYYYKQNYITKKHCIILTICIFAPLALTRYSRYIVGGFLMLYLFTYHKEIGNNKIVKFFAHISYPMFLIHAVFPLLIWSNTNCRLINKNGLYFFILYPVMIPICYFIYRFIEKPFNDFGRKITAKMK